jgi:hypothetical protein
LLYLYFRINAIKMSFYSRNLVQAHKNKKQDVFYLFVLQSLYPQFFHRLWKILCPMFPATTHDFSDVTTLMALAGYKNSIKVIVKWLFYFQSKEALYFVFNPSVGIAGKCDSMYLLPAEIPAWFLAISSGKEGFLMESQSRYSHIHISTFYSLSSNYKESRSYFSKLLLIDVNEQFTSI